jgi:hypothetical protein
VLLLDLWVVLYLFLIVVKDDVALGGVGVLTGLALRLALVQAR